MNPDWHLDEIRNQIHYRDVNEWIRRSLEQMGVEEPRYGFLCECGDADCRDAVGLTLREYELVRAGATRFLIAPDHENPELDLVVDETDRFSTIAALPGEGERLARATDPRA